MNSSLFSDVSSNYQFIRSRIEAAGKRVGREVSSVQLVAACKKQPVEKVQAFIDLCKSYNHKCIIAYNFVQEFRELRPLLKGEFESHLIGPLQRNKVKDAVSLFDVIESVHSDELAAELNRCAAKLSKTQRIFVQINISNDSAKSGFDLVSADEFLSSKIENYKLLRLEGLMTITRLYSDPTMARPDFKSLYDFRGSRTNWALSMGMSEDFEYAVEEGATHVRIGTALFGGR